MTAMTAVASSQTSLPSRERGLKSINAFVKILAAWVAPFAGAWIEISRMAAVAPGATVAPFTGAWIEIGQQNPNKPRHNVAPFTGAWIEMPIRRAADPIDLRRSLHGSVD